MAQNTIELGQGGFNDLRTILSLRDLVAGVNPAAAPVARLVCGPADTPEQMAVLSGSFNPLTIAHTALAAAVWRKAPGANVFFLLSRLTVDKERVTGASLEDRLLVLERCCTGRQGLGVLLVNRGLYVEQAAAARGLFPELRELYFVVGFDKIVQILDPRYYADRDAALAELFGQAAFLVAPRGTQGARELRQLMARPENRPYRDRVVPLPFSRRLLDLSSTRVREESSAGRIPVVEVPAEVVAYAEETGAYLPPARLAEGETIDRYALRASLIDLLAAMRPRLEQEVDFRRLLEVAWSDAEEGRRLRCLPRDEPAAAEGYVRRLLAN